MIVVNVWLFSINPILSMTFSFSQQEQVVLDSIFKLLTQSLFLILIGILKWICKLKTELTESVKKKKSWFLDLSPTLQFKKPFFRKQRSKWILMSCSFKEVFIIWAVVRLKEERKLKMYWKEQTRMNKIMMEIKFLMIQQWMILLQEMNNNTRGFAKWMSNVMKDNAKFILTSLKLCKKVLMELRSSLITGFWLMKKFQVGSYKPLRSLKVKKNMGEETDKENKLIILTILLMNSSSKCVSKMMNKNRKMLAQVILSWFQKKEEEEKQNLKIKNNIKVMLMITINKWPLITNLEWLKSQSKMKNNTLKKIDSN